MDRYTEWNQLKVEQINQYVMLCCSDRLMSTKTRRWRTLSWTSCTLTNVWLLRYTPFTHLSDLDVSSPCFFPCMYDVRTDCAFCIKRLPWNDESLYNRFEKAKTTMPVYHVYFILLDFTSWFDYFSKRRIFDLNSSAVKLNLNFIKQSNCSMAFAVWLQI